MVGIARKQHIRATVLKCAETQKIDGPAVFVFWGKQTQVVGQVFAFEQHFCPNVLENIAFYLCLERTKINQTPLQDHPAIKSLGQTLLDFWKSKHCLKANTFAYTNKIQSLFAFWDRFAQQIDPGSMEKHKFQGSHRNLVKSFGFNF